MRTSDFNSVWIYRTIAKELMLHRTCFIDFGEKGKHSRIDVGVQSLPLDSMTEIDALVQIR